jgi:hypothetical protein
MSRRKFINRLHSYLQERDLRNARTALGLEKVRPSLLAQSEDPWPSPWEKTKRFLGVSPSFLELKAEVDKKVKVQVLALLESSGQYRFSTRGLSENNGRPKYGVEVTQSAIDGAGNGVLVHNYIGDAGMEAGKVVCFYPGEWPQGLQSKC